MGNGDTDDYLIIMKKSQSEGGMKDENQGHDDEESITVDRETLVLDAQKIMKENQCSEASCGGQR